MFSQPRNLVYIAYKQSTAMPDSGIQFYTQSLAETDFEIVSENPRQILVDVVDDKITVSISNERNLLTNVPLPAGFDTAVPLEERGFGISSSNSDFGFVDINSINYYDYQPIDTTTIAMSIEESNILEIVGELSIDGIVELLNGSALVIDPWPEELDDPNSQLFQMVSELMTPCVVYAYEATGLFSQVNVNVTRFRHGSIISDYIVSLRSLTSLTNEQIREKVQSKVKQLAVYMVTNMQGLEKAVVNYLDIASVKILYKPTATTTTARPKDSSTGTASSGIVVKPLSSLIAFFLFIKFSISFP